MQFAENFAQSSIDTEKIILHGKINEVKYYQLK